MKGRGASLCSKKLRFPASFKTLGAGYQVDCMEVGEEGGALYALLSPSLSGSGPGWGPSRQPAFQDATESPAEDEPGPLFSAGGGVSLAAVMFGNRLKCPPPPRQVTL